MVRAMEILASYLAGAWTPGTGPATPLVNPTTEATLATVHGHDLPLAAALAYYFLGYDQGAVSVFGSDTHIHEFIHDSRHFLGFPCH